MTSQPDQEKVIGYKNQKEELMKVIYDLFDVLMPLVAPPFEEKRPSKKSKRTFSGTMEINPKRKNTIFRGEKSRQLKKRGGCGVAGTSHRMDWSENYLEWC